MSLRIVFDESHGEQISIFNCKGLTYILEKLKIVSFRLVTGPITIDKIVNEDVLFLGAPIRKFLEFEIKTIEYFVSKGKFLIIACPMPMPFNFTLNDLLQKFGMYFNNDVVQDKKDNLDGAMYFPIIKKFSKDLITQALNSLVYSGCSIKKLDNEVKSLAITDAQAEPPSESIIAAAKNGRVIAIGGHYLFQDDDRYGIKAKNNRRLVANIFRTILQRQETPVKGENEEKEAKQKFIDPKKAKKHFEQQVHHTISEFNKINDDIDKIFGEIINLINSQKFPLAEKTLQLHYSDIKETIESAYQQLMAKLEYLDYRTPKDVDFPAMVKESMDQVLVMESDTLSKLDMIRFNLFNRIRTEKVRYDAR